MRPEQIGSDAMTEMRAQAPGFSRGEDVKETPAIRHPEIKVKLVGTDGNAFAVLGKISAALKKAGVPKDERDEFFNEAMSGDYNHLIGTAMQWVDVA
jgi:hypothetical protein